MRKRKIELIEDLLNNMAISEGLTVRIKGIETSKEIKLTWDWDNCELYNEMGAWSEFLEKPFSTFSLISNNIENELQLVIRVDWI